ncbi:MAG TPA: SET domain-containing protein [Ignavibacteria bacterium]|nr:SET domain-containing protein [Ignavibacteria bacterium]
MRKQNEDFEKFISVKKSSVHGKGIFTPVDIPRNKIIMPIIGEVISGNECERREDEENNVYIFWNGDTYIDTAMTDKIKYINHNCDFNCDVIERDKNSLSLIAYRNIKAGEELTIDYGYEEIYEDCKCGKCNPQKKNL